MKEVQDHFFRKAKEDGYRARSAYKLIEIDDRKKLLRPGDRVLDVGAAPGSWTQVAAKRVGERGLVVGVDLKAMDPRGLPGHVKFLRADLRSLDASSFDGKQFHVVLSDMAPDTSGDPFGDSVRSCQLCHDLLDRLPHWLRRGGHSTMKVFEGSEYPGLLERARSLFEEAKGFKPKSSRAESVEIFIVCKGYRGPSPDEAAPPAPPRRRGWGEESSDQQNAADQPDSA
ncbi:MAG: RlmE family RNA methyltransferase [Planctomycetota bacterium]|nr:RlmE family RNA methyltransferase [Planctomycetota bacterium]MDA1105825.1 RlmE family RNA methyltransferase [Planctomycetota bacterium]